MSPAQAGPGEGPEFPVGAGRQRHPPDRAPERREPAALLRRPPRPGLRLGGTAEAGDVHPTTGAAQWVEIRETVQEVRGAGVCAKCGAGGTRSGATAGAGAAAAVRRPGATRNCSAYGVPAEWLDDVRQATEDTLLALSDHLPAEAAEALLELATGGKPRVPTAHAGGRQPLRPSRRAAPFPRDEQRGGAAAVRSISRGKSGPSSCTRNSGSGWSATMQRAGAGFRFGRYGQDDRGPAPGRVSRAHACRRAGAADDLLRRTWRARCTPS
jgi:hypothetical protein